MCLCFCSFYHLRSAAQVERIKVLLPADYAQSNSTLFDTSAGAGAGGVEMDKSQAKKTKGGSMLSTLFGQAPKEGVGSSPDTDTDTAATASSSSYHDQRFQAVLDSCHDSLTYSCKKKLMQAYKVQLVQL
jgi:hypothetical protein